MRRILITGATGFTGRHVVPLLLSRYGEVTCFVRRTSDRSALALPGVRVAEGTLDTPDTLRAALEGHDTLVNIASLGFGHAESIVEAARAAGVKRAVFVSTTSVFTSLNAPSKVVRTAAEAAVMASGLDWTILRPTMIYGTPGDRNMIRLLRFLKMSPVVPVLGTGEYLQQPIHVEDLASAIVACLDAPTAIGKAYNLSGAHPLTYNQVVEQACEALGVKRMRLHVPLSLSLAVARLAEKLPVRFPVKEEQILRLNENKDFDHAEAQRDFGFTPRAFAEGIRQEAMQC